MRRLHSFVRRLATSQLNVSPRQAKGRSGANQGRTLGWPFSAAWRELVVTMSSGAVLSTMAVFRCLQSSCYSRGSVPPRNMCGDELIRRLHAALRRNVTGRRACASVGIFIPGATYLFVSPAAGRRVSCYASCRFLFARIDNDQPGMAC